MVSSRHRQSHGAEVGESSVWESLRERTCEMLLRTHLSKGVGVRAARVDGNEAGFLLVQVRKQTHYKTVVHLRSRYEIKYTL